MKDPNLNKIIESNLYQIKKNNLGTSISQANSYLTYIYAGKTPLLKAKELDAFIEELKSLANKFTKLNKTGYRNRAQQN